MTKVYNSILETIGNTPIVKLHKCVPQGAHSYYGKVEYFNPGSSVKDRIALAIIEDAERSGKIKPGGTLIEATSGNTGVGLGLVAAIKGYKCIFVMPEKISEEKRATLRAYGARVVITPNGLEPDDPRSHYSVAKKFAEIIPNSYCTNQYHNPANVQAHYARTGPEIWEQMEGQIDVFVGGAGTGGTVSGVGRYLREKNPNVRIVCADPIGSILYDLFYHKEVRTPAHPYLVEGIGEDMLPDNVHLDVITDFVQVTDAESFAACREIVAGEGILVGPSAGTGLAAAIKFGQTLKKPAHILAILPDSGRSYLTKAFNETWLRENGLVPSLLKTFTVRQILDNRQTNASEPRLEVKASLQAAARVFRETSVQQLPVFDGSKFAGILELTDLMMALAEGRLRPSESILHLLKASLPMVESSSDLQTLQDKLRGAPYVMVRDAQTVVSRADLATFLGDQK